MNILVLCAVGMSTSLLVSNMEKSAAEGEIIKAASYLNLEDEIDAYDVVLVGPQLGYKITEISKICEKKGKICGKLDMIAFGRMDGKAAYEQAARLLSTKQY